MSPVIPFRRRSNWPIVLWAIVAAAVAFAVTMAFLNWQSSRPAVQQTHVKILGPTPRQSPPIEVIDGVKILRPTPSPSPRIEVIDGDTVRSNGEEYRLVGFDTPERGERARCDDERTRAEAATRRLRTLVASGDACLIRVACSCRPGQEGTKNCNFGRLCASLSIGGRDVGSILIGEGLAHPYVCGTTSCPQRRPWCQAG
jgi:endonuclease YncB( thermonuclease family)